jgi:threonine/homoserine/homoserine lactone efflux protein
MPSTETILLFLSAAFLLTISPGPDILGTISIGLARGWRSAVGFGVGCGTGCLLHTLFAVIGVSAAVRASPMAFTILKYCGAAYLAWLGISALRSRGGGVKEYSGQEQSGWQHFGKGLLANAINPKVGIFFLSFLPGFVAKDAQQPELQMAFFGLLFTAVAVLTFAAIGYFSGRIGGLLNSRPTIAVQLDRLAGLVFLALAISFIWMA